jgi:hypothetical protein
MRVRGDVYKSGKLIWSAVVGELRESSVRNLSSLSVTIVNPASFAPPGEDYEIRLEDGQSARMRFAEAKDVMTALGKRRLVVRFKLCGGFRTE